MGDSKIETAVSLLSAEPLSLKEYSERVIKNDVNEIILTNFMASLTKGRREEAAKQLALDLSLDLVVPAIFEEVYWSRRCISENWRYVDFWMNDCNWRDTFACQFVEDIIDQFLSRKTTFGELANGLVVFQKCLKKLKINGYKGNVDRDENETVCGTEDISFQDFVANLFRFFSNAEEVYLNIAPAKMVIRDGTEKGIVRQDLFEKIFLLQKLSKLTIIGYSLTNTQLAVLAENMNDSIQYLNLSCNQLNDDCCHLLSRIVKNSQLQKLILSKNCIGSDGITKIILALAENRTLSFLDVSKNNIGDAGGIKIAELLKSSTLKKLDLSFNKLAYEAGFLLGKVIQTSTKLLYLNISGNTFGKDVGKVFARSVSINQTILFLEFEFCGFGHQEEDVIFTLMQKNRDFNDDNIFL